MKKLITIIITLFITTIGFSQQIGDGLAPIITDFTVPLKSGIYNGSGPIGASPDLGNIWQHLFVMRHANADNNYQLQIASSFSVNDRLFFRKIASENLLGSNPVWVEIATRGINTFSGNQVVNGNLNILSETNKIVGFADPNNYYIGSFPVPESAGLDIHYYGGIRFGDYTSNSVMQITNGNVGIGTINPKNKLDVNGTVHSKEVKLI